ncbi:MAG: SRPBCC family protein [Sporichthyaceae bacterium]
MSTVATFQREARIRAPLHIVWQEVGSLNAILKRTPKSLTHEIAESGRSADLQGDLRWGPIRHKLAAKVGLLKLTPGQQISYRIVAPSLGSQYDAEVTVHQAGTGETQLEYRAELDLGSWTAQRLRGMINELLEEHINELTEQVKARAERRHRADESLGN